MQSSLRYYIDIEGLYEWQCQDCGFEYIDEETCNGCPQCNSDNVQLIGEADEERGV